MKRGRGYWAEHVTAWRGSGVTLREYCERHDLVKGTLSHWAWRLKSEQAALGDQQLVELPTPAPPTQAEDSPAIELEVGSRYLLRLRPGTDSGHLRQVIKVLEGRR